ncbi:hypothetical protein HVA01_00980 [Halovibrio variabilis]|uniref:PRC-barrel domain-containing protein n=1 Tax=Halovibrio variabilis TaxID=31910 RepID=A0A511UMS2_9GAMM|nr:PRC-barrel domain-containing protein [Halovibrio variabilis]GEN26452.1 hypothetical protein HVA01_00980 [Halovibrio variabilis]
MSIKRKVCVSTLTVAAGAAAFHVQAQDEMVRPLSDWNYEDIYQQGGIRADNIMGAEVFGSNQEEIGRVENVLITQDNQVTAIIAQVGGFWVVGGTHVLVPWEEVELHEDGVMIPVTEDNADEYGLFASEEYVAEQDLSQVQQVEGNLETGSGVWKLSDLLNDYASIGEGVGYGYIDNVLFTREGEIQAIIVESDVGYGGGGAYAYPFYGYGYDWSPGYPTYSVQYNEDEIGDMEAFDYDRYDGLLED